MTGGRDPVAGDESALSAGPPAHRPIADEQGLHFRAPSGAVVDVLFDGWRVWSIPATAGPADPSGTRHVAWPPPLRRFLDGRASVSLRLHGETTAFAEAEASFGSGQGRVKVADKQGRRLAMTKWGQLDHPFDVASPDWIAAYLDEVERVLAILSDECGVPAFISYGTLLGAVRGGDLIGHDVDVDVGYLSDYQVPADVQRESFRIERILHEHGYPVFRQNGGFLVLFVERPGGGRRNLDVFASFVVGDMLYQVHDIGARGDRSTILPLQRIPVAGRLFPAPAHPHALLEAAYGSGWRHPDPTFEFNTPRATRRRIGGWLGGLRTGRDDWFRFYRDRAPDAPQEPTAFARWVAEREEPGRLIDVGCGDGRDSLYFASRGFAVVGLDYIRRAYGPAERIARERSLDVTFEGTNLYSLRETLTTGARISHSPGPRVVYGRFLLHALDGTGRENTWRLCDMALRDGGRCYLEFRTPRDRNRPKRFQRNLRRFLSPDQIAREAAYHGGRVVHREEGVGLARFTSEDPHVCRMIVEWGR